MCECDARTNTVEQWEARLEGRPLEPSPHEVTGPAHLVTGDEWGHCVVCTGCGEIRQID